jgi:hypothetical protein
MREIVDLGNDFIQTIDLAYHNLVEFLAKIGVVEAFRQELRKGLDCGKVIVQRRSWTVKAHDLIPGNYTGVSNQLVVAVEKLRAERNLPRFIYIRPTEQALRRSGEGRDKDTKPVFVDLQGYLFLEIFHRWLIKAGEIEVTEMLPDPEHLFWKESNGRHSFELRTLIVPRS